MKSTKNQVNDSEYNDKGDPRTYITVIPIILDEYFVYLFVNTFFGGGIRGIVTVCSNLLLELP